MRSLLKKIFGMTETELSEELVYGFEAKYYDRKIPWKDAFELIIYNDDVTPFQFVIDIFEDVFQMSTREAIEFTARIHSDGRIGIGRMREDMVKDVVERIEKLNFDNGQSLRVSIEKWAGNEKHIADGAT